MKPIVPRLSDLILRSKPSPLGRRLASRRMAACTVAVCESENKSRSISRQRAEALAAGFDEVLEREWAPDTVVETHTHSFAVEAVVVRGEMWLSSQFTLGGAVGASLSDHAWMAGLYLGASYTHPGAGVHGACGANAADAVLRDLG